ncbi:MAG: hypothetical protein EBZ46_08690 [Actinobacteria bacterium]|nr:hypothetical protein [Actinomycetota bacterium]
MLWSHRHHDTFIHLPSVEPFFNAHDADACFSVAGQECAFDGRCTAPTWQQREVHIDHWHNAQDVDGDDSPIRDDHAEVRLHFGDIGQRMCDGEPEIERGSLDRAW